MSVHDRITSFKSPAYIDREMFEWLRENAPFPPRYRSGTPMKSRSHPDDASGMVTRFPPDAALLPFVRMEFACHDCGIMWHCDDLEGRLYREVPCPYCEKIVRNHISRYCFQGYYDWDAYTDEIETIKREAKYWSSVDILEKKSEFSPYERMAQRRSARMRREERDIRRRQKG